MMMRIGIVDIDEGDMEVRATRASGAGGQHVNRTDSAIQLRITIPGKSIWPERVLARLRILAGNRLTEDGILMLEASESRSQLRNRETALERLRELVLKACIEPRQRKPTKPSYGSICRRLESKTKHSEKKRGRSGLE
jgi:ribosome-associated protein